MTRGQARDSLLQVGTRDIIDPRFRLKPNGDCSGYVDGAWWPRTDDLFPIRRPRARWVLLRVPHWPANAEVDLETPLIESLPQQPVRAKSRARHHCGSRTARRHS